MKFARYSFLFAGIAGLLLLLPQFFLEAKVGVDTPPAITHPEFYYGFLGLATVFQFIFFLIAFDPSSFRLLMPIAIFEKLSFGIPSLILYWTGRMAFGGFFIGAMLDLVFAVIFVVALTKVIKGKP
ncbi:MAG TPA: hypothetical protein PLR83_09225 [Pyrinomonadaceae bacterium]|nr:hypothetical protein [Pyrinomonadaceae bacterium]